MVYDMFMICFHVRHLLAYFHKVSFKMFQTSSPFGSFWDLLPGLPKMTLPVPPFLGLGGAEGLGHHHRKAWPGGVHKAWGFLDPGRLQNVDLKDLDIVM